MGHCSSGPAADTADTADSLQAMIDWVEQGQAPDRIAAKASATPPCFPQRSRPWRAYPTFARYQGAGSTEDAASFRCAER